MALPDVWTILLRDLVRPPASTAEKSLLCSSVGKSPELIIR